MLNLPVCYYTLQNRLRVILSENHSLPILTVGVYYHIGFRQEPRGRTGFAHLFEHLMFQGSRNLGKGEFLRMVQGVGGQLNGSTRLDFTNFYETVPSIALRDILWAEADRMGGLAITEDNLINQKAVVTQEVKSAVMNTPYGGFPWLDLPQHANNNWCNAHNFYGDLQDIDAATMEEVSTFFDEHFGPQNAVLVVCGDIDRTKTVTWIEEYFSPIRARAHTRRLDTSERLQKQERQVTKVDALAPRPALAIAYRVPTRWTDDYFAFALIDRILLQGAASRLNRALVESRGFTDMVSGGINARLGNMFNYQGPMLWFVSLIHDFSVSDAQVLHAFDTEIVRLQSEEVSADELSRAINMVRSEFYDLTGAGFVGLVDLLACFALFDGDPSKINEVETRFERVTPMSILRVAQMYFRKGARTILTLKCQRESGKTL